MTNRSMLCLIAYFPASTNTFQPFESSKSISLTTMASETWNADTVPSGLLATGLPVPAKECQESVKEAPDSLQKSQTQFLKDHMITFHLCRGIDGNPQLCMKPMHAFLMRNVLVCCLVQLVQRKSHANQTSLSTSIEAIDTNLQQCEVEMVMQQVWSIRTLALRFLKASPCRQRSRLHR